MSRRCLRCRVRRQSQPDHRHEESVLAATATDPLGGSGEVEALKVHQCSDFAEFISGSCFRSDVALTSVAVDGTILRAA